MTNKQSQAHISPEEPTPELLLRRFKLMDAIVEDVRKKNIEAGLDPKYMSYYIIYDSDDTPEKKKYLNWLAKVTNKKNGNCVNLIHPLVIEIQEIKTEQSETSEKSN